MHIAHPGPKMCITPPSRSYLTCIKIPISSSHIHPCTVSPPFRSEVLHLICIHVTSHLQPAHVHSSHDVCTTAPSLSYLTPIHVSILAPELHPLNPIPLHLSSSQVSSQPHPGLRIHSCPVISIQFPIVVSLLHPHRVSPPSRSCYFHFTLSGSQDMHLTSIHSLSHHIHPVDSHLTSIQVRSHLHPGPKICISYPLKSPLNPILLHLSSSQVPS